MIKLLLFALAADCVLTAHAAPLPDYIPLGAGATNYQIVIPVYSRARCEEILGPMVDPLAVIARGLNALGSASASANEKNCLSRVLED